MHGTLLLVLVGPTGVGKTRVGIHLARRFGAPIVSADSRQFYRELKIGTAAPSADELRQARHYFVGTHSIYDNYSSGRFEVDALELLQRLFTVHPVVMLLGGSMMYVDAVCHGIDDLPSIDASTRAFWQEQYRTKGLVFIREELNRLDPALCEQIDLDNPKRVLHALEVCTVTGQPYSSLRLGVKKERPFDILKIGLNLPRKELYARINGRVDQMMAAGLLDEARRYFDVRHLNALDTVGYKELYQYMEGRMTLAEADALIKRNTRRYAKRQLSWFNRDREIHWFHPDNEEEIVQYVARRTSLPKLSTERK